MGGSDRTRGPDVADARCRAMTMALGAAVLGWLRSCLPGQGLPGERR